MRLLCEKKNASGGHDECLSVLVYEDRECGFDVFKFGFDGNDCRGDATNWAASCPLTVC